MIRSLSVSFIYINHHYKEAKCVGIISGNLGSELETTEAAFAWC